MMMKGKKKHNTREDIEKKGCEDELNAAIEKKMLSDVNEFMSEISGSDEF